MRVQALKAISAMSLACCLPFVLVALQGHKKVARVEFRLADTRYSHGLIESIVTVTGAKVYLHKEVLATEGDILQAHRVLGDDESDFGVVVSFTTEGAKRMDHAAKGGSNRRLAVLLDGDVVAALPIEGLNGEYWRITGFSKAEADRIAKAMSLCSLLALLDQPGHAQLEIRLAQRDPAKGLIETVEKNTHERIFLFEEVLISKRDVSEARVVKGYMEGVFDIELGLTHEAAERIAKTTESHKDYMLAVLINGRVMSAPIIIGKVSALNISGDFTKEEAEKIANALNTR